MVACPIPTSISALPLRFENGRQWTMSALAPRSAREPTWSSRAPSTSASGSLCCSQNRSVICMKFTPCLNLISSARFCRRTASLNWRAWGIFSESRCRDSQPTADHHRRGAPKRKARSRAVAWAWSCEQAANVAVSGMTGISAPAQVSRSAYRAVGGSHRMARGSLLEPGRTGASAYICHF